MCSYQPLLSPIPILCPYSCVSFTLFPFLSPLHPLPSPPSILFSSPSFFHSPLYLYTHTFNSLQSMMDLDDLYPGLPEEAALTSPPPHLPQSPTLSHIHLHPSQSPIHEYECPTHTAEELRNISTQLCRMEISGKGKFQLYDTVITDKVTRHVGEYNSFKETHHLTSRL